MRKLGRNAIWIVSGFAILLFGAIPPYLYFDGLKGVPENREPLADLVVTESVAKSYWRYLDGEGQPNISPKNPYGFIFDFLAEIRAIESRGQHDAEYSLLSEAARVLMFREKFNGKDNDWHLSNAAASIWISRNWSVEEAMATVLHSSYFGNGFHGIEAAARGYFGIPASDLSDVQMMYVLVIRDAPNRYDPWCNPEIHKARFEAFSKRIGYAEDYDSMQVNQAQSLRCS